MNTSASLLDVCSGTDGIGWPPIPAGSAAVLAALLHQFEDTQWLSPEEIAASQFRQLAHLAAHAQQYSTQFAGRLARAHLAPAELSSVDGLRRLPPLKREDIQTAGATLFCRAVPDGHPPLSDNTSSGSTGMPVLVKRTSVSQIDWSAITIRDHLWWRRDFSWRTASIRSQAEIYGEREDWGRPASFLFETGPGARIPITTDIAEQVRLLRKFAPNTMLAHPSNLEALTNYCRDNAITIPSLVSIRTIGETLWPHVREDAAAYFNATVTDCYSSQEIGYLALECPESRLYHTMEPVIVELLDDNDQPVPEGASGRVVVTDLHNFATPLIRYDLGDYAERGGACPCGRGLPTLARVLGRQRNLIVLPDGRRHWPISGFQKVRAVAPVKQFQFVQNTRDAIELRLVTDRPLTPDEETAVRAHAHAVLGHPFMLELKYFPDTIPLGPGGKFEQFVCKVS